MFSQIQMTSIHLLQPQPSCEIQTQPLSKTAPLATAPQALPSQSGRDTHQQPLSQLVCVLLPKVSLTTEVPIGDILGNLLLSSRPCLSRAGWTRWPPDVPLNLNFILWSCSTNMFNIIPQCQSLISYEEQVHHWMPAKLCCWPGWTPEMPLGYIRALSKQKPCSSYCIFQLH